MKQLFFIFTIFMIFYENGVSQVHSGAGVSFKSDHFPEFRLHDNQFTGSSAYTLQFTFFDRDYTRMEYGLHYTRGYDAAISYSAGFSAAYVIMLTERFFLKPGLGLDGYKMKNRTCRTPFRSVMNRVFNVHEPCPDDVHTSFNPFLIMELKISEPVSFFFQTTYRAMLSSVDVSDQNATGHGGDANSPGVPSQKTEHSFYSAGSGFGFGLRIHF